MFRARQFDQSRPTLRHETADGASSQQVALRDPIKHARVVNQRVGEHGSPELVMKLAGTYLTPGLGVRPRMGRRLALIVTGAVHSLPEVEGGLLTLGIVSHTQ